jgi:hypothetical protein
VTGSVLAFASVVVWCVNDAEPWSLQHLTDVVDAAGKDATYGNDDAWQRQAERAMTGLVELFADALSDH